MGVRRLTCSVIEYVRYFVHFDPSLRPFWAVASRCELLLPLSLQNSSSFGEVGAASRPMTVNDGRAALLLHTSPFPCSSTSSSSYVAMRPAPCAYGGFCMPTFSKSRGRQGGQVPHDPPGCAKRGDTAQKTPSEPVEFQEDLDSDNVDQASPSSDRGVACPANEEAAPRSELGDECRGDPRRPSRRVRSRIGDLSATGWVVPRAVRRGGVRWVRSVVSSGILVSAGPAVTRRRGHIAPSYVPRPDVAATRCLCARCTKPTWAALRSTARRALCLFRSGCFSGSELSCSGAHSAAWLIRCMCLCGVPSVLDDSCMECPRRSLPELVYLSEDQNGWASTHVCIGGAVSSGGQPWRTALAVSSSGPHRRSALRQHGFCSIERAVATHSDRRSRLPELRPPELCRPCHVYRQSCPPDGAAVGPPPIRLCPLCAHTALERDPSIGLRLISRHVVCSGVISAWCANLGIADCRVSVDFRQLVFEIDRPNSAHHFGRSWPPRARFDRNLTKFDQTWPEYGPNVARCCRPSLEFAQT